MLLQRLFVSALTILLSLFTVVSYGQGRIVTGTVMDANGSPLQAVTVSAKNSAAATQTNETGSFSISVPANETTLVFTSVGYATLQQPISGNVMNVVMASSATALENVVVVAYGTRRKEDLTGSVAAVNAKDFQKGSINSSEQLLQGKVPGLQITSGGGSAGGGSTIRIRGGSSINATNDPLIVIDGVPVDQSNSIAGSSNVLNTINPNDIESMSVLKDASATALYGSRASNGVIIITTKKGARGRAKVNFNTLASLSALAKKVNVLNGDQIREIINADAAARGDNTFKNLLGTANTDWQDQIYRKAFGTDNNISVSGTAANMLPYRVSLGYLNQNGILKTDNFNRFTGGVSLTPNLLDEHLQVTFNAKFSQTKNRFADGGAVGAAATFDPTQPVMALDGGTTYGGYFQWLRADGKPINTNGGSIAPNPLDLLMLRDNRSTVNRLIGNLQLDYKLHFLPDLHFIVNLGLDKTDGSGKDVISENSVTNWHTGGRVTDYKQGKTNTLMDVSLFYEKNLRSIDSRIDVLALHSFQDFTTDVYNYPSYSKSGDTIIAGTAPTFATDKPRYAIESYLGRINYTLANKYLLTASIRRDAVSRFAPENRVGYFPALALAWRLDQEFPQIKNAFDDLKLRFGWGKTGQQAIGGLYDYMPFYGLSAGTAQYQFGDKFYSLIRPSSYDASRKWETSNKINFGLDYALLKNRIFGSFDVYQNKTEDLLFPIPIAPGANFDIQLVTNVGNVENKGLEFIINTVPVRQDKLTWDLGFNFSYNTTKITKLSNRSDPNDRGIDVGNITGGTGNTINKLAPNQTPYVFYTYKQVYYKTTDNPIEGLFADVNRDGKVDDLDRTYFKKPMADFLLGFNTQVAVDRFTVGLTGHGMIGNYLYNNFFSSNGALRNLKDPLLVIRNVSTNYLDTKFANNQYLSNYYVENASFFRFDNLNLGYNFGRIFNDKAGLRVLASIQNLFVITKYKGLDPENSSQFGIDNTIYPRPRIYSLGLNLDF